jgi:hypothetical protein
LDIVPVNIYVIGLYYLLCTNIHVNTSQKEQSNQTQISVGEPVSVNEKVFDALVQFQYERN